jgi:hypothetical protein
MVLLLLRLVLFSRRFGAPARLLANPLSRAWLKLAVSPFREARLKVAILEGLKLTTGEDDRTAGEQKIRSSQGNCRRR